MTNHVERIRTRLLSEKKEEKQKQKTPASRVRAAWMVVSCRDTNLLSSAADSKAPRSPSSPRPASKFGRRRRSSTCRRSIVDGGVWFAPRIESMGMKPQRWLVFVGTSNHSSVSERCCEKRISQPGTVWDPVPTESLNSELSFRDKHPKRERSLF